MATPPRNGTLRSRTKPTATSTSTSPSLSSSEDDTPDLSPTPTPSTSSKLYTTLDLLRPLILLPILLPLISYLSTSPPSFTFGHAFPPPHLRPHRIRAWWEGPLHLTDAQLSLYNGTDASLPILLGLAGEIYDVSASPHFYGPGGSYGFFAGRDGTRGFVTGCWDLEKGEVNGDLRGVGEGMFLDPELLSSDLGEGEGDERGEGGEEGRVGRGKASGREEGKEEDREKKRKEKKRQRKLLREREIRMARKKVNETVEGWRQLFDGGKGGRYFWRGTIDRGPGSGWEGWGEVKEVCESARFKAKDKGEKKRRTADQV